MSSLREIGTDSFQRDVLDSATPVLVDFYAPWCGPCQMMAPLLDTLSREYTGQVEFVKVNVDVSPELADRYRITGVPTLMIFRGGKVVDTLVGMGSPRRLRERLDSLAQPTAA